jgi:hypothetical protein
MRKILLIAGGVAWIALCLWTGAVVAQEQDPLAGLWLDDGRWKWEITKVDTGYTVRELTSSNPANRATVTFKGTQARIDFVHNTYEGWIRWNPTGQEGIRVFTKVASGSPQRLYFENRMSMVRQQPPTPAPRPVPRPVNRRSPVMPPISPSPPVDDGSHDTPPVAFGPRPVLRDSSSTPGNEGIFLTSAIEGEGTEYGRKVKVWVPTKQKISFAWADERFAIHIPFDLLIKRKQGRPAAGSGEVTAYADVANKIKMFVRGFQAPNGKVGLSHLYLASCGVYRVDGQQPKVDDPSPMCAWKTTPTDPSNLDILPADKPVDARFYFAPSAQTKYVYWIVVETGTSIGFTYWDLFNQCDGSFFASIEDGAVPPQTVEKKIALSIHKYVSGSRDNHSGETQTHPTPVTAEKDDGFWEWYSHDFKDLEREKQGRLNQIFTKLQELAKTKLEKRSQWLTLLRLDQMAFPPEPQSGGDILESALQAAHEMTSGGGDINLRQSVTQAVLTRMKEEREQLKTEMAAIKPQQVPLIEEGIRLIKQVHESAEGQEIRSRDVRERPELKQLLVQCEELIPIVKLQLYDAAGWYTEDELPKAIEEFRYESPNVRAWIGYLKMKMAMARAIALEEKLSILYSTPNRLPADSPLLNEPIAARIEALNALREIVSTKASEGPSGAPGHDIDRPTRVAATSLQALELGYLDLIAAKLDVEKKVTYANFKEYCRARGYEDSKRKPKAGNASAQTPEQQRREAERWDYVSDVVSHSMSEAISSMALGTPRNLWPWSNPDRENESVVDLVEREASRRYADLTKDCISIGLIKNLIRAGLPMSTIRNLTADQLDEYFRAYAPGRPIDKEKVHRLCQDLHETFAGLADLRALADGNSAEFAKFLRRSYYDVVDPSKSGLEEIGDAFLSPGSIVMAEMGGMVGARLAQSLPISKLTALLTAGERGQLLAKMFAADLTTYEAYSTARKFAIGVGSFAAHLGVYHQLGKVTSDRPILKRIMDVILLLGPTHMIYSALTKRGLSLNSKAASNAVDRLVEGVANAKIQVAESRNAIQQMENAISRPQTPLVDGRERPVGTTPVDKPDLIDPASREAAGQIEAMDAAVKAAKSGDMDEARRCLAAAREFNRELENLVQEYETKVKQAREFLAREGIPQLTDWQDKEVFVAKKKGTPFITKTTYPEGPHADSLRFGDIALIRGDSERALELYRAALKIKRKLPLPNAEGVNPDNICEARVALAEQILVAARELEVMRSRGSKFNLLDEITEDRAQKLMADLESGKARLVKFEGARNPIYYIADESGAKRFVFKKTPLADESEVESLATAAVKAAGGRAPACRALNSTKKIACFAEKAEGNRRVTLVPNGEVEMAGTLTQYIPGADLYSLSEAQVLALRKELAVQRVLRLWLGDLDGHLGNIRIGDDGQAHLMDFGWANLTGELQNPMYANLKQRQELARKLMEKPELLENLDPDTVRHFKLLANINLPVPAKELEAMEAVLMAADVICNAEVPKGEIYGWVQRTDGTLNYDDMHDTSKAIWELCHGPDKGERLLAALRATGAPEERCQKAFDVLRLRADLLHKVLPKRFPTFNIRPIGTPERPYGLNERFHRVLTLVA